MKRSVDDASQLDARAAGAKRFLDRVAIVTGAGQGIGRAVAFRLAEEGATVVVVDRADAPARDVVGKLLSHGVVATALVGDLSRFEEATRVMSETRAAFGRIDVLVNNVGGTIWMRPFWHYAEAQIRAEVDRSFWPTVWCCRAVLPHMLEAKRGAIVNVGSNAPRGIYRVPYAASKGGVFALTTSLALELARSGIRVNCVAPGPTEVPDRPSPRNPEPPTPEEAGWQREVFDSFERQIPMGRWATVEEQAAAIAFLASDEASFITGQILSVAGGATVP